VSHLVGDGVKEVWQLAALSPPPYALLQHHVALPAQDG
jgi:hypothetical protein